MSFTVRELTAYNFSIMKNGLLLQGSASGTRYSGSRDPGLGNLRRGPRLKFKICGIREKDRDLDLRDVIFRDCPGD